MSVQSEKELLRKLISLVSDEGTEIILEILEQKRKAAFENILDKKESSSLFNQQGKLQILKELTCYFTERKKRLKMLNAVLKADVRQVS